jgi:hypothetical protein
MDLHLVRPINERNLTGPVCDQDEFVSILT